MRAHIVGAVLLVGCGSDPHSSQCSPQIGAYNMHLAERAGGTCGAIMDSIIGANTQAAGGSAPLPPNCSGMDIVSADHCTETIETSCRLNSGGAQKTAGAVYFAADGASGTGIIQIQVFSIAGVPMCASTYDVTVTRI